KGLPQSQLYGFIDHGWLHNIAPVPGTFANVDAASLGAGLRLGWLNAITADLSVAQAVQGTGLLNTGPVPGLLETGPRKNTRFFFILSARLYRELRMHPRLPRLRNLFLHATARP